jgi:hypothetical protein
MGAIYVKYEELKRELVWKTPEEIHSLIEKYKQETSKLIEDCGPKSYRLKETKWWIKIQSNSQKS